MKKKAATSKKKTSIRQPAKGCRRPSCCSDVWEYSEYRATLRLNGKFFALITPDGRNAISKDDMAKLLAALNRPNVKVSDAPDKRRSESEIKL